MMSDEPILTAQNDTGAEGGAQTGAPAPGAFEDRSISEDAAVALHQGAAHDPGFGAEDAPAEGPLGAPDEYGSFALPDGMDVDGALLEQFKPLAKELNMTQADAQKFVDLHARFHEGLNQRVSAAADQWEYEATADPEYGGVNFDTNMGVANGALKRFGTPELTRLLSETRLGSHPEVIRVFHRIGQAMSERGVVSGDGGPRDPRYTSSGRPMLHFPSMDNFE